jgi:parallel beta-helix repeat protein
MKKNILLAAAIAATTSYAFAQGSLTPPGAPGATMKTLDQIEARTPVSGSTNITQSGSYYLTGNVTDGGISISANDVTLDLRGFSLVGSGSGNGITISSGMQNVVVRNGTVKGFSAGVVVVGAIGFRVEDVMVSDNASHGIYLNGASGPCSGNTIKKCTIIRSGGDGIHLVGGSAGECGYNFLQDCIIGNNGGKGVYVEEQSANVCRGNEIKDCRIVGNSDSGVRVEGDENRIIDNVIENNNGSNAGLAVQGGLNIVSGNTVRGHEDNYNFTVGNQLDLLISEIPESIDWSSSVKLAGSLVSTNHGITITVSDVTVDLSGFTLRGEQAVESLGIRLVGTTNSPLEHIRIKNGTLRNFAGGLWGNYVNASSFENLTTGENTDAGIILGGCTGNRIVDCTVSGNGTYGIYLISLVNGCNRNTIEGCAVTDNGADGIVIDASSGVCNGNRIHSCSVSGNEDNGIIFFAASGTSEGNSVKDCTLHGNDLRGIYLDYANSNRIEGNHISGTTGTPTYGIITANGQNNLVIRNSAIGHDDNFSLDSDDTYGPEISASGEIINTNPWANFSF